MLCKSGRVRERLGRERRSQGLVFHIVDEGNTQSHKEQSTQSGREKGL